MLPEGKSINGKPIVNGAVPAGDKVCIVAVQYDNEDQAGRFALKQWVIDSSVVLRCPRG